MSSRTTQRSSLYLTIVLAVTKPARRPVKGERRAAAQRFPLTGRISAPVILMCTKFTENLGAYSLFDDPSLGLALVIIQTVYSKPVEINDAGTAILLVEQNLKAALRLAHVIEIIFEDLHWIDAETQALDSLVESLPTARLLLLVNYRPEYQNPWTRKTYYRQLSIDPPPPESADELLTSLLGNNTGLAVLKQLLIERTDGNPFFLEESVRTLVETKALSGERGAYVLTNAAHIFQIPNTAQAILAARIDRLSADEKRYFRLRRSSAKTSHSLFFSGLRNCQRSVFGRAWLISNPPSSSTRRSSSPTSSTRSVTLSRMTLPTTVSSTIVGARSTHRSCTQWKPFTHNA
jgi:hypothetical protein